MGQIILDIVGYSPFHLGIKTRKKSDHKFDLQNKMGLDMRLRVLKYFLSDQIHSVQKKNSNRIAMNGKAPQLKPQEVAHLIKFQLPDYQPWPWQTWPW